MESRKGTLSALKQCRFCLSQDELTSLYKRNRVIKNAISLPLKIMSCVSIEVYPSDKMPTYICNRCKYFMDIFYEFKNICRQGDENILQFIENGNQLESVPWPPSLIKIYLGQTKQPEVAVMKAVVESGATVQLTTQDLSDTDMEDDENVYNIKIGDGSDDESKSTRIKVITGSDKEDIVSKNRPKRVRKATRYNTDSDDLDVSCVRTQTADIDEGCWACDQCDCTYPLQQLLELHKMQKHRYRNAQCDQCDAKFFTKYDLAIHQLRHSSEMLFQCVACNKKFKRHILLKRHEKLMHADLPQRVCLKCPASFLSLEELEAHQQKHNRIQNRPYVCPICEKKFPEKSSLQRHKDVVHDQKATFKCEYCPERHATVSKLARHVRSHASERPYPCKYCDKTFMKSHHYTRHLRMKHRDIVRSRRGPFGEQEQQYRCDQCEDSFSTQDELIYHSAIHATQNLICPLCQEKFADVDAVTAHIKTHVTDTEFMCDYCELIFTTKEKLDDHISFSHEDELRSEEQGESSIELEGDDDDEDAINVKEENGEMVVEIKKADEFMITNYQGESEDKVEITNSDESDAEDIELSTIEPMEIVKKDLKPADVTITKITPTTTPVNKRQMDNLAKSNKNDNQTASIIRKVEEMKRKVVQHKTPEPVPKKKEKINKVESASDKSLRLLEKELQDLKRTNSRSEIVKTPAKNLDVLKNRKTQVHTSTPKLRSTGGKESQQILTKSNEKKLPERRLLTKENSLKESKEVKDPKNNSIKEEKEKEVIDKEPPKEKSMNNIKNVSSDKNGSEEAIRRSTRPSKIKDYAKMIRDSSQDSTESPDEESDEEEEEDDEEFGKLDKPPEPRPRFRRASIKQPPTPKPATVTTAGAATPRKRGRPRKDAQLPSKIKKEDEEKEEAKSTKQENANSKEAVATADEDNDSNINSREPSKPEAGPSTSGVLVSPTGQTLKKVPIKALPPGVKPLPLPANARLGSGEVCEMQIGKKLVKVQKIVMTKAEVEAMAKKGLVEMKDGTMVLKQGVNPAAVKSTLVGDGEGEKESPSKKDKATPTRCDLGDDT